MVFEGFTDRRWQAGLWALALLYLGVVLKDAWLCDDAYISFRTVDNFIHGYGLRWNVSERVQGYTHPLWLFLISGGYWISGEIFYTSIVLSVVVSVAAVAVFVLKISRTPMAATVGLGLMVCSKAYVDYSTSGLENPLTHLLLSLFLAVYLRDGIRDDRAVLWMGLIAGLALVNRMDSGLIYLPALLLVVKGRLRVVAVGMLPFLLWEMFSLFYYGFPFPNTAYAKLNTGIDRSDLLAQGIYYWIDAFRIDPLTPVTILAGGVLAILRRKHIRLVVGIGLYSFYVVWMGGDFMTGRFLTAPFFCAICPIGQLFSVSIHRGKYVLIAIFLAGLLMPRSPLRGGIDYGSLGFHRNLNRGIADERAYHYAYTGIWNANLEQHSQVVEGRKLEGQPRSVVFHANVGYFGFYAGPNVHLVDAYGLNEPLLARLYPDARFEIVLGSLGMEVKARPWRIGHFIRKPPAGYQKTQEQGENQIVDPNLAAYYDRMTHVVTGDLWDMDRLKTIWLFHL